MPRILIIDDDSDCRTICRAPLEQAGFEVGEAADADEGVERLRSEGADLVILDVLMPSEYEGFEAARRIREELEMRDLPILMLSAVHDVKQPPYRFVPDQQHLPVDAFLDKPVSCEVLVEKVRDMLGLRRETPDSPL